MSDPPVLPPALFLLPFLSFSFFRGIQGLFALLPRHCCGREMEKKIWVIHELVPLLEVSETKLPREEL